MREQLARELSVFLAVLSRDAAGREVLAEAEEKIHFRLSDDAGVMVHLGRGTVTAQPAAGEIDPAPDVTRLICDAPTLTALIAGQLSFWEAVIPMSESSQAAGAIVFGDNWMAKKGSINRFGRICRLAQERHGFVARDAGRTPDHTDAPRAATDPGEQEV